jgi:hypothetical protein
MANCVNYFDPSSLFVQQTKIYYDVKTYTGATTTWESHRHLFQASGWSFEGVMVQRLSAGLRWAQVWVLWSQIHFICDCYLSGQSKKVGYGCPHCFREIDSQYLNESRKIVYMGHRRYIPMKHSFWSMNYKFNVKYRRRRPEGVNGSQTKFLAGIWSISQKRPDAPFF